MTNHLFTWGKLRAPCSAIALILVLAGGSSIAPGGSSADPSPMRSAEEAVELDREEGASVTGRTSPSTGDDRAAPAASRARPDEPDRATGLDMFRGLGAWVDLFDMGLDPGRTVRTMAQHGVKTLYLQTGHSYSRRAVHPGVGPWLVQAHRAGIAVVGWYLPDYSKPALDRRRTLAIATYSYWGHRFDGLGIDIENRRGVRSARKWSQRVVQHAAAVNRALREDYPIASIPPTPLQMRLAPSMWTGFPWRQLGEHTDAFLLMSYWSERGGCPRIRHHCAYEFTRYNVELTRRLVGDPNAIVHVIGGVGDRINGPQLRAFARGAQDGGANGASIYDVATTRPSWWKSLRKHLAGLE